MSTQKNPAENRMGTEPIGSLILKISFPVAISMLVSGLYNIVDSIFVARISEEALAAISLVSPIATLKIALGVGTCVGVNAYLTRCLGEKRMDKVNRTAGNGLFLHILYALLFIVGAVFLIDWFIGLQTGSDADRNVVSMGVEYARIYTIGSAAFFIQAIYERYLLCTGKTVYSMISQAAGAVINIILDPILIFGYLGAPAMGVRGAAIATAIGMIASAVLAMIFHYRYNTEIHMSFGNLKPDRDTIRDIYRVGFPSILMQSVSVVMNLGMNRILMAMSSTAMAIMGAYAKLESFVSMPLVGLNFGLVSLLSYNYGARKGGRMVESIKKSFIYACAIMLFGMILFMIIPRQLLMLYDAEGHMMELGITALRLISLSFVPSAIVYMGQSVFQSMERGTMCLGISVATYIAAMLPSAYLLARFAGETAVWWSFAIAQCVGMALTILGVRSVYARSIRPVLDEAGEMDS